MLKLFKKAVTWVVDGAERPADEDLAAVAEKAFAAKKSYEKAKADLEYYSQILIDATDGQAATLDVPGYGRIQIVARQNVRISDLAGLRRLLGPRFADLVEEKVSHRALPKLVALATDGDDGLGREIRKTLVIDTVHSVIYREA